MLHLYLEKVFAAQLLPETSKPHDMRSSWEESTVEQTWNNVLLVPIMIIGKNENIYFSRFHDLPFQNQLKNDSDFLEKEPVTWK